MLRSPKQKFLSSAVRPEFEKMVTTPAFEEAYLAAFAQMQADEPEKPTPNQAADAHNRMQGARKFIETLCAIHIPEKETPTRQDDGLNDEAGV